MEERPLVNTAKTFLPLDAYFQLLDLEKECFHYWLNYISLLIFANRVLRNVHTVTLFKEILEFKSQNNF